MRRIKEKEETLENQRELRIALKNKLIQEKIDLEQILATKKLDELQIDKIEDNIEKIVDKLADTEEILDIWDENGDFNYNYGDNDSLLDELLELDMLDQ